MRVRPFGELDLRRSFADRFLTSLNKATVCIVLGGLAGVAGSVALLDRSFEFALVVASLAGGAFVLVVALALTAWDHHRYPPPTVEDIFHGDVPERLP